MQLSSVCFADDVILFSSSKDDVVRMLAETREAFKNVGLDVRMEKTTGLAGLGSRVSPSAWTTSA